MPDGPVLWEPIWKRPRTPKSKAEKKQELRKQRRPLQDAGLRRLITGQSRRHRPGRTASATRPRTVPGAARLAVVTMHDTGWSPPGGARPMGATGWAPPRRAPRAMDATLVRTTMSAPAPGAHHLTMPGTLARARRAASDVPHRTGARRRPTP